MENIMNLPKNLNVEWDALREAQPNFIKNDILDIPIVPDKYEREEIRMRSREEKLNALFSREKITLGDWIKFISNINDGIK